MLQRQRKMQGQQRELMETLLQNLRKHGAFH